MKKILALLILLMATATAGFARTDAPTPDAETVTFRFRAGADMFLLKGNEAELTRLYALVDTYREQIADGRMPVYVDGYCTSLPTAKENRRTAYLRASRVKSESELTMQNPSTFFVYRISIASMIIAESVAFFPVV